MATILQKLRTIIFGNAHALLDKIIDETSIPSLKQNIRDLEEAIRELQDEAATAEGSKVTAEHKLTGISSQVDELNKNIDFILGDSDDANDHLAEPLQARLIGLEKQQSAAAEEVEVYKQTMQAVDQVVSALQVKLQTRLTQLNLLESQDKTSEAKNKAAKAIEMAARLGDGPSVDNIEERIQKESNIADARLRRAMGSVESGLGQDALLAGARERLAIRKAQLKSKDGNA